MVDIRTWSHIWPYRTGQTQRMVPRCSVVQQIIKNITWSPEPSQWNMPLEQVILVCCESKQKFVVTHQIVILPFANKIW